MRDERENDTSRSFFKCSRQFFRYLLMILLLLICLIIFLQTFFFSSEISFLKSSQELIKSSSCKYTDNEPELYYLKTISGVHYDGGHWFHVAENFMVQHSLIKQNSGQSSEIYFLTDRVNFNDEMNGVTRFMFTIGLTNGQSKGMSIGSASVDFSEIKIGSMISLDVSDFQYLPVRYSLTENEKNKFVKKDNSNNFKNKKCFKYMGSYGGEWPTPQRGHWFPTPEDITSFRSKIVSLCPFQDKSMLSQKTKKYKMLIYQRNIDRFIVDVDQVLTSLKSHLPTVSEWSIQVMVHDSSRSPCTLASELYNTDVLLTAHGFQSMLLLFLPRPSLLFEVYPYRYFKPAYSPLSAEYGILHGRVMSPPQSWLNAVLLKGIPTSTCMLTLTCREFARGDNVELTEKGMIQLKEDILRLIELRDQLENNKQPEEETAGLTRNIPKTMDILYSPY